MPKLEMGLITQAEAARRLGVTRGRVWQLIAEGRLPTVEIAGTPLVPTDAVEELAKERLGG